MGNQKGVTMQHGKNNQHGNWTLVITTQHRENYAAHNSDYKHGVDEAHWKFKGGSIYYVRDITDGQRAKIESGGIPTLTGLIENRSEAFEEYVISVDFVEPGMRICDHWEIPTEFYWDDVQRIWRASTHHTPGDETFWNSQIISRAEQWQPLPGGVRHDYECQFKTKDGWFDRNDPKLKDQLAA